MDWIIEFLKLTPEYQSFGMNALTVSAFGAICFTFLQAFGLRRQGRNIWEKRSGSSISVIFMGYSTFYFIAFFLYGTQRVSITMTFNGLLFLLHVPIMIGLLKFKGFTRFEWICLSAFAVLMSPGAFFFNGQEREIFLLVLLFGILLALASQTYETWKGKTPGVLDPKYLVIFLLTNVFWFVYAVAIDSLPLIIFSPCAFVLIGANLLMYYKYKRKDVL